MSKKLIALIIIAVTVAMTFSACNTTGKMETSSRSAEIAGSENTTGENSSAAEDAEPKSSEEETESSEEETDTFDESWKQAYHDVLVNPETYVFFYMLGDNHPDVRNGNPWVFDYSLMDLTGDGTPELYIFAEYYSTIQALVGAYEYKQGKLQSLVPEALDDYVFSGDTFFYENPETKERFVETYLRYRYDKLVYALSVAEDFSFQYKQIYTWTKDGATNRDCYAPHPEDKNIYHSQVGYDFPETDSAESSDNPSAERRGFPQQLLEDLIEDAFPEEYRVPAQAHFQGEGPLTSKDALAFLSQEGVPLPEAKQKEDDPSFTPVTLPKNSTKEVYTTVDLLFEEPFEGAGIFFNGYCPVKVDGKWGIINRQGEFTAPPIWEIMAQHDGKHAVVGLRKNLEDDDSRILGRIDYDGSLVAGVSEGISFWVGVIDMDGNLIQPLEVMETDRNAGPSYPYFIGGVQPRVAYFYDASNEPVHESQSYFLPLEQPQLNSHEDDTEYRGVEYPVFRNGSPSGHELFLFNELSEDRGALRVPLHRYVLRTKSGAAILPTDKKYIAIHNLSDEFFLVGELTNELDYVTKVVDKEYNTIIEFDKYPVALPGALPGAVFSHKTLQALYYGESFVITTTKGAYIVGIVEKEKGAPYLIDKPWYNERNADD